jgi:S-adenosyl methyltransferase
MDGFPEGVDTSRPSTARVYDCLLGGTDNFPADRELFGRLLAVAPECMREAMANRSFLHRVVRFLAAESGISQFLDIGSGLPTRGNVHLAARETGHPGRVVYVDNDPGVVAHGRALLGNSDEAAMIVGDIRRPQQILASPEVRKLLDPGRPVAVMLLAVLHHVNDDEDPAGITMVLHSALPPGSYLAISHFRDTSAASPTHAWSTGATQRILNEALGSGVFRSQEEILGYFADLALVEPGLVPLPEWRPARSCTRFQHDVDQSFVGGVARKE